MDLPDKTGSPGKNGRHVTEDVRLSDQELGDRVEIPKPRFRHFFLLIGHRSLGFLLEQSFPFLLCQLVWFENYDNPVTSAWRRLPNTYLVGTSTVESLFSAWKLFLAQEIQIVLTT